MKLPGAGALLATSLSLLSLIPSAFAANILESESLEACQANSGFTATLFQVAFTPNNDSIAFNVVGVSTISGNVTFEIDVAVYGYNLIQKALNPCDANLDGLCPMSSGQINIQSNIALPSSVVGDIPGIAYQIPDLDAVVQVKINDQDTNAQLACVQTHLSNGKTVYQKGVGWSTACVAGLALGVSAIVSGLGHSNTASHIAANAMSLFGFFQAQAFVGMTAVDLPPIVQSWTQNFQWSMGIIRVGFIQSICTWYQQATGGTPSTVLSSLSTTSVSIEKRKRAISTGLDLAKRAAKQVSYNGFTRRATTDATSGSVITVRGIQRVGFVADIELTNIFLTGYIFFIIFVIFIVLGVVIFRWVLEAFSRSGKMKSDKFQDFRNGWTTVLRGILFRLILIGFPQMVVLCFWELATQDSDGEEALAVITIFTMIVMLVWACTKVWLLARRSISMHKNPAYILYSDPVCLHKWGFLYVQFKATQYWYIIPLLCYILIKGLFVAFGQNTGITQAIAFVVLEAALLLGVVIMRPYMDKKTNAFNISIAAVNFVSAIFLLFFTDVFGLPGLVVGIMGVIHFFLNAIFALILIILVLIATAFAIFSKNPDTRYQPMRDDRGSFIKSQTQMTTELDALGATARGEGKTPFKARDIDEDSYSGSSWDDRNNAGYSQLQQPYNSNLNNVRTGYDGSPYAREDSVRSNHSHVSITAPSRSATASPWQRGAGYDR